MGLGRGQVLNLAMGGYSIFDAVVTYERNRTILSSADIVVVQLDGFQFTTGIVPGPRYEVFASLSDRMAFHGAKRARLIKDWFVRTDSALVPLYIYLNYSLIRRRPPEDYGIDRYGRLALVPITGEHDPREFTERAFRGWINEFYREYEHSPVMEGQLARMVTMAQERGAKVYLIHMPTAGNYLALLEREPGNPYLQFKTNLTRAAQELGARCQFWEAPAEVGLTDRDFVDWGHLNTPGAEKWSQFFVRWLQAAEAAGPAVSSARVLSGGGLER